MKALYRTGFYTVCLFLCAYNVESINGMVRHKITYVSAVLYRQHKTTVKNKN